MKKIIGIGELLIDFIPNQKGVALNAVDTFSKKAGGAPANVCVAARKMGTSSKFLGQVGQDAFGDFLIDTLRTVEVDTTQIIQSKGANTALAFVSLSTSGERDFVFYRNPSADQLYEGPADYDMLKDSIIHFCSVSLIEDYPIRTTHKSLLDYAKKHQIPISFDPNIRLALSKDDHAYQKQIESFLGYADILKIASDELSFITGKSDYDEQIQWLNRYPWKVLVITLGSHGVTVMTKERTCLVPGYKVDVVDTTGAGDAWIGAFLSQLALHEQIPTDIPTLTAYAKIANAYAALTTTAYGAIEAMPSLEKLKQFIKEKDLKRS
jgi:fructokinase